MVKVYQTDYEKTISGFGLGLDVSAKHTLFLDYNLDDKNKSEVLMPLKLVLKSDFDRAISLLKESVKALEFMMDIDPASGEVLTLEKYQEFEELIVNAKAEEFLEECK